MSTTNYMMEQEARFVFHIPTVEGAETVRREGAGVKGSFGLCTFSLASLWTFPLTEEEHARTAALCFLCGQPAATGTSCHAGAGTLVYI